MLRRMRKLKVRGRNMGRNKVRKLLPRTVRLSPRMIIIRHH